jgi:hypothetical protein
MRLENDTRGTSFTKVATVAAPDTSSAEWIAEAPSACTSSGYCQVLPLADFGKVRFTKASATTADGHTGTISDPAWTTAAAIDLQVGFAGPRFNGPYATSERGEATTSALSNGGRSFSVRWREVAPVDPTTVPGGPWSYGFG